MLAAIDCGQQTLNFIEGERIRANGGTPIYSPSEFNPYLNAAQRCYASAQ
jgi:hypothetical protein